MPRVARVTMQEMPAPSASTLVRIAGNACAAVISLIHIRQLVRAMKVRASDAA
jgi:hypothetical protein